METVSYGAQLSFLHCMDAFEEENEMTEDAAVEAEAPEAEETASEE